MNFVYMDSGLIGNLGHHANSCRHITEALRSRNIPVATLVHRNTPEGLCQELDAIPWFRVWTYGIYDQDPLCGWLANFQFMAETMLEDLQRIDGVGPDDLVYVNSAQPAQFMAVVRWIKPLAVQDRPVVIVEFGSDPGVVLTRTPKGMTYQGVDPRYDPRSTLLRYTARHLDGDDQRWLRLATYDKQASEIFQHVLGFPVGALPLPQKATTSCRNRAGKRPITVSILGHQRLEKGYALVPELAERLLKTRSDIRILVHNGAPNQLVQLQQIMRKLAATDRRLVLNEETANAALWSELLEESDLIVCPYDINRFIASYSAVATEAIANAIPFVAPAGSTMARVLEDFGNPGTAFTHYTVDSVFRATESALNHFDRLANLAAAAAHKWDETQGPARLVDAMLEWRSQTRSAWGVVRGGSR